MKFVLMNMTAKPCEFKELEDFADKLSYMMVADGDQLFNVGIELLSVAKKRFPAAELRMVFEPYNHMLICNCEEKLVSIWFVMVKGELEKLDGEGLPDGFLDRIGKKNVVEESLNELSNGHGALLVNEFCYLKDYIKWSSERLETTPEWDTDSMMESMDDAVRLVNGLLGYRFDKEE